MPAHFQSWHLQRSSSDARGPQFRVLDNFHGDQQLQARIQIGSNRKLLRAFARVRGPLYLLLADQVPMLVRQSSVLHMF